MEPLGQSYGATSSKKIKESFEIIISFKIVASFVVITASFGAAVIELSLKEILLH